MDPLTIFKIGGSVLSGLGAMKRRPTGIDLKKLRKDAIDAGFNPLTVLRLTGAAGYERKAQPSPLTAIGGAITAVGDVFDLAESQQMAREQHQLQKTLVAEQLSRSRSAGGSAPDEPEHFPLLRSRFAGVHRDDVPYWNMRAPDGTMFQLRATYAERLGIGEGSQIMAEDWEAILGDVASELLGSTELVAQAWNQLLGGGSSQIMKLTQHTEQPQPLTVVPEIEVERLDPESPQAIARDTVEALALDPLSVYGF